MGGDLDYTFARLEWRQLTAPVTRIFFTYLLPLLLASFLCATCNHRHFEDLGRRPLMALVYKEDLIGYLTFD